MKPLLSYFGSKAGMAPWLVSLMPAHRVYVEPFCGSAAVLLAKDRSRHEVINDVDGDLVNFYRVARARPDDLEVALRLTPYSRDEFAAADLADLSIDELERARRYWVRSTQGFAQVASTSTGWSTSIVRGANNARTVWNRLGRIAPFVDRMGTVTIENRNALEVIDRYDAVDGVIYLDPPYFGGTRTSHRDGRRPGGDYVHEFASEDDHRALAEVARAAKATVLLSGYPHPLYDDELYADWHRVERRVLRRTSNGRSGANSHALEVVWSNREIPNTDGQLDLTIDREELHA